MTTQFEAQNVLDTYHDEIEQQIGLPFCAAAARSGQTAAVLERLPSRGSRVLVCASKKWTEWEQPSPAIAAGQTCESVNSSRELPVHCQVVHANGMYTMSIKFMRQAELEQHIKPMLLHVAEPFCKETTKRGDGGLVRLQRAHDDALATYNCETRTLGPWLAPRTEPAPQSSSPAPSSASRPNRIGASTL